MDDERSGDCRAKVGIGYGRCLGLEAVLLFFTLFFGDGNRRLHAWREEL
jgi:hypothetical protein